MKITKKPTKKPTMRPNTIFSIILILFTGSILAQDILWYGDPNKSVNSSFRRFDSGNAGDDCNNQSNNGSSVSTINDSEYGKVWRIRKPKGQKRGEFARTSYIPNDGEILYYGWRWKITSNPSVTSGIAVWQWKTDAGNQDNTQNYPLNMGYSNGRLSLNAYGPCYPTWNSCGGSINKRFTNLWSKAVAEGTWVSLVVKMKLSRNKDNGYVEFWFNGEKQTLGNSGFQDYQVTLSNDKKRAYHKTFDGKVIYPKWGSYNANSCNFDTSTYYDEMRIGKTLEAATPSGTNTSENQLPTVSFVSPQTDLTVEEGYELQVQVDANDTDGSIKDVKLYIDDQFVRAEVNPSYDWGHDGSPNPDELNNLTKGTYAIKAVATDDDDGISEIAFTLTVEESTLSIDQFQKEETLIYPNPSVAGIFSISKPITWQVYSLLGKKIKNGYGTLVDLKEHAEGLYILKIKGSSKILVKQ